MYVALMILVVLLLLAALTYAVLTWYPAFGGNAAKNPEHRLHRSSHYEKGKFRNLLPAPMNMSFRETLGLLGEFVRGRPNGKPAAGAIPHIPFNQQALLPESGDSITWFGHSALLLRLGGKTLLLDPMLGRAPSPFPFIGGKRYGAQPPLDLEKHQAVDAVLLSHDHYDHLDYGSIQRLKGITRHFIVPLGVGAHLIRWGVSPEAIEEHDWGDEFEWDGFRLACTPARHFSGRSIGNRDSTLWCSWVIDAGHRKVFFSGDSGYGPHFEAIGEKYGPFDLTLMECGQYDKRWANIHMMPEETVQAHVDVRGKLLLPIHWGAFTLAMHTWSDPVERASRAAAGRGVAITTPRIGETVKLSAEADYPHAEWWV